MVRVVPVGILLCLASVATAAPSHDVAKAKDLFERGRAAFTRGEYLVAIDQFRAGNELAPRPLFLFNIAQSLRKLGESQGDDPPTLTAARAEYRRYIDTASVDEPERVDALRHLLELESKLSASRPVTLPPADAPTRPVLAPSAPSQPQPTVAPATVERTWLQRNGLWLGVAAGVAVVGAASVGVWATTACHASLGCVDARR